MWYFVNALDIHSTHQGMKYACLREGNPLLPDRPTLERLIIHKTVILAWIQHPDYNRHDISKRELKVSSGFIAAVAMNNYRLADQASEDIGRCPRVR